MTEQRELILRAALDRIFPRLSDRARQALTLEIIRFGDKAIARSWKLEEGFQLGAQHVDRSTELSRALRNLREKANVSLQDVVDETRWSPSKLNRIEAGDVGISATDTAFLLRLYRVSPSTRSRVLALNAADRERRRRNQGQS